MNLRVLLPLFLQEVFTHEAVVSGRRFKRLTLLDNIKPKGKPASIYPSRSKLECARFFARDEACVSVMHHENQCSIFGFPLHPSSDGLPGAKGFHMDDNWQQIENSCTADKIRNNELYFPHPYDNTKFIRCDYTGDMYITQCQGQKRYITDSHVCGTEHAVINNGKKPIVGNNIPNPCTVDEIRNSYMYFPYPGDFTKYIHCDPTGMPWENSCQDGFLWFQDAQTCSPDYQHQGVGSTPLTFVNPCTKANIDAGNMLFHYPSDSNKYVQCDVSGVYSIHPCPAMLHFSARKKVCVRRDESDAV